MEKCRRFEEMGESVTLSSKGVESKGTGEV